MTFYEAAIEVLLKAGRPLHYKKITEAAIQANLLSHVGKTPELTMSERLMQESKRAENSPLVCIRPGVYMLREESAKTLQLQFAERAERQQRRREERQPQAATPLVPQATLVESDEEDEEANFELEGDEEAAAEGAASPGSADERSSRRRRRRGSRNGRRGRDEGEGRRPAETPEAAVVPPGSVASYANGHALMAAEPAPLEDVRPAAPAPRQEPTSRPEAAPRAAERTPERGQERPEGGREGRGQNRRSRGGQESRAQQAGGEPRQSQDSAVRLEGIAEAAHTVLRDSGRRAMRVQELADEIFNRRLVRFHTHDAATTVQAALANDAQLRTQLGQRPIFVQYDKLRWGLAEWGFSANAVRKEQQMLGLAEDLRQEALRLLGQSLAELKTEALEHLALTLLERLGYRNSKVSKRSSDGDVYFTADWRQGLAEVRVSIQVSGSRETELPAEAVTDLRSTLHHYSASEGVIIHLGAIHADAVRESREERLAPITLIDRNTFVDLLIRNGIGVRTYQAPVVLVDMAFVDALRT